MDTDAPDSRTPPARERLLAAAQDLMRRRGYAASSVQEVCRAAGVTKGSFFHHFASKEALAAAVAERYGRERRAAMRSIPSLGDPDPRARILGFVDFFIAHADDPGLAEGCLLGSLGQEVAGSHPELRSVVAHAFDAWSEELGRALEAARPPGAHWDPASVARHFIAVFEGALILAKAGRGSDALRESLSHFKSYLASLLEEGPERRTRS